MTTPLSSRPRLAFLPLLGLLLTSIGLGACTSQNSGGSVSVLASWTGDEEKQFRTVLDAFTDETGIKVHYEGTTALSQVLPSEVQQGTPPDIAVLPSTGELAEYVQSGDLQPLDGVIDKEQQNAYGPWLELLKQRGKLYSVPVKASLKSIIWSRKDTFADPPRTWNDLLLRTSGLSGKDSAPWCVGMGDAGNSGWPGTDWIEDILLHQSGVSTYQKWAAGDLKWTSPQVKQAWTTWGKIVGHPGSILGGTEGAALTDFGDAGRPMFDKPPGCFLEHQGSFTMNFADPGEQTASPDDGQEEQDKPNRYETDAEFFRFPAFGDANDSTARATEVSADLAGMFNGTGEAKQLMQYLADDQNRERWLDDAHAFSLNEDTRSDRNKVGNGQMATFLASSSTLCLDASDLMPATMREAFYRAVLEFMSAPDRLDTLLAELDGVRQELKDSGPWLDFACG